MNDTSPVKERFRNGRWSAPRTLQILSLATPLFLMLAGFVYWTVDSQPRDLRSLAAILVGCFGLGVALGAVVFASAALLAGLRDIAEALVRVEKFQYEIESHSPAAENPGPSGTLQLPNGGPAIAEPPDSQSVVQWQELLLLVRDIRDNSLLNREELAAKKLRVREDEMRNARDAILRMMEAGDFSHARQLARNIAAKFPDDADAATLTQEVEEAREKRESVGSSRVDLQACKLEYSIVSPK